MLKRRLGDEEAFFTELAKQYSAEEESGVAALVRREECKFDTHLSGIY